MSMGPPGRRQLDQRRGVSLVRLHPGLICSSRAAGGRRDGVPGGVHA
jgi:hypothetical protein